MNNGMPFFMGDNNDDDQEGDGEGYVEFINLTDELGEEDGDPEVLPEGALFDVKPAYEALVPEIEALALKLQAAGVQFVMGFCYSHEHCEDSDGDFSCEHGQGVRLSLEPGKSPLDMSLVGELLMLPPQYEQAVAAALKAFTVVRAMIKQSEDQDFQQKMTERMEKAVKRRENQQASNQAARMN